MRRRPRSPTPFGISRRARRRTGLGRARRRPVVRRHQETSGPSLTTRRRRAGAAGSARAGRLRPSRRGRRLRRRASVGPVSFRRGERRFRPDRRGRAGHPEQPPQRRRRRPRGRLWFGTMDNGEKAKTGRLLLLRRRPADAAPASTASRSPTARRSRPTASMLYFVDTLGARSTRPTSATTAASASAGRSSRIDPQGRPSRRADDRQRRLPVDRALRGLGSAALCARRRADRARALSRSRTSPRSRSAATICAPRSRPPRAQMLSAEEHRQAAADRRPVRVPSRRAGSAMSARSLLILVAPARVRRALAAPTLDPQYGDHAVVQRDKPMILSGTAAPGEQLTVTFAGAKARQRADASGRWSASFPAPRRRRSVHDRRHRRRRRSATSDDVTSATCGCARASRTWNSAAPRAQRRRRGAEAQATRSAPDEGAAAAGGCAASDFRQGCRVARRDAGLGQGLLRRLLLHGARAARVEKVPIGAIHDSWGGTPIRAWMNEAGVRASGGAEAAAIVDLYRTDPTAAVRQFGDEWGEWWRSKTGDSAGARTVERQQRLAWKPLPSLGYWDAWGPQWKGWSGQSGPASGLL